MSQSNVPLPKCEPLKILTGQKAIVTGGSSGIGKAVALALEQPVLTW